MTRNAQLAVSVFSEWHGGHYWSAWKCGECGAYGGLEKDDVPATEDSADSHTCGEVADS